MDRFFAIYERLTEVVYPDQYLIFHFIFGGAQFFLFGLLTGVGYRFININNKHKFIFIILSLIVIFIFSIYGVAVFFISIIIIKIANHKINKNNILL